MSSNLINILLNGTGETLYMVFFAGLVTVLIGTPLGVILFATEPNGLLENKALNKILSAIVNITRSIPFIILIIALIPFTRVIVGMSIGSTAAIVPLSVGAIPFFARIVASAMSEVNPGLIEAGHTMGASNQQIIWRIMLPEALVAIIHGSTLTLIALVGYSAMAGTVGGGGLGAVAINYGYQRFDINIMLATVFILVLIVYVIQFIGDQIVKRIYHGG